MRVNLLEGNVTKSMLLFSIPMILGNLLQQLYNIADTLIVGRFIGADALAAVGSSFTLMTFLTSVILGLCMGSGVAFSMCYGAKKEDDLKSALAFSFLFIAALTLLLTAGVLLFIDPIIDLLQIPAEIREMTQTYLRIIFYGMVFTFFYNYFASVLRAFGNSLTPLIFLGISAVLNIALDLCFVLGLHMGVAGAAWATVLSQAVSAAGVLLYCLLTQPILRVQKKHLRIQPRLWKQVIQFSILTSVQQSIMNFGILMIQGLLSIASAWRSWRLLPRRSKSTPSLICRFRISATPFPRLLPRIRAPEKENGFKGASAPLWQFLFSSVLLSLPRSGVLPGS